MELTTQQRDTWCGLFRRSRPDSELAPEAWFRWAEEVRDWLQRNPDVDAKQFHKDCGYVVPRAEGRADDSEAL